MLSEVFRNDHYQVQFNSETRLIRVIRTAEPQSISGLLALASELLPILNPLRPAHVLLDMRRAPGNNDPAFEQGTNTAMRQILVGFSEVAVLVQTAIGRLHFQRIIRASGQPLRIFTDEAEALRFLSEQPLDLPSGRA